MLKTRPKSFQKKVSQSTSPKKQKTTTKITSKRLKSKKIVKTSSTRTITTSLPPQLPSLSSPYKVTTPKSLHCRTTSPFSPNLTHQTNSSSLLTPFSLETSSSSIITSQRRNAMALDPLGRMRSHGAEAYKQVSRIVAARSTDRRLNVLLAGYTSFFAQHLFGTLVSYGFNVIPVSQEGTHETAHVHVHSTEYMSEYGLPDADFVINCSGLNPWAKSYNIDEAHRVKVDTNRLWADLIRKTPAKPYAYLTMSSMGIYPGDTNELFTDNWECPGLSEHLHDNLERHEFDEKNGITKLQAMWRDAENSARVFIPELDTRTAAQLHELELYKRKYDHDEIKSTIHGNELHPNEEERLASVRKGLLTNSQVRVIPLRMPIITSAEMQEVRDFRSGVEGGRFGPVRGHENAKIPWMWVDDACRATVAAMIRSTITGPVNVTTPQPISESNKIDTTTTNAELMTFISNINKSYSVNKGMTIGQLEGMYGDDRAKLFYQNRLVVPSKLNEIGFKPLIPTLGHALKQERSSFEREIQRAGGIEKLSRFGYRDRR